MTALDAERRAAARETCAPAKKVKIMDMDMRKYTGPSYIKLAHVKDGPLQETIGAIKEGKFGKPELVFESGCILSANATNCKTLFDAYGPSSRDWIGKQIELFFGATEFEGKELDSVCVRPISPSLPAAAKSAAAAKLRQDSDKAASFDDFAADDSMDDDVPY
jgi:hypothetical protein